MKKLFFVTLLIALGVAGSLIYTSKPEAEAASTRNFRINLKDGRVTANDDGFGRFNEQNSGPFGKATTDDTLCLHNFPGQRNWNSNLGMYLWCRNDRQGPNKKETFYLTTTGYGIDGASKYAGSYAGKIDGNHWRSLCDLHVSNVNSTPMVSRDAIVGTTIWRVYGLTALVSKNTLRDTLDIYGDKPAIANRIRVTGTNPVNFDVKLLPVFAWIEPNLCCGTPGYWKALYRPSVQM